ncbi:MAG: hypothetical protein HONBIEJF_01251 [Fimbriimonadaceae bacterium]|nr:hypothetical protein [Fimbriimonadaceae bacterium]
MQIPILPVLEWSPHSVRVFDPATKKVWTGKSVSDVRHVITGTRVVLALSHRSVLVRAVRLPNATKEEVSKILTIQLGSLLPIQPEEASVDFMLADDVNTEGRLAVVCAVKSEHLRQAIAQLEAEGIETEVVVPSAMGNGQRVRQLGATSLAVVEAVPEGFAIDIWSGGVLRASRVVPAGSTDSIADEVCRSFSVAKLPCGPSLALGGLQIDGAEFASVESGLEALATGPWPVNLELPEVVTRREHRRVDRYKRYAFWLWFAVITLAAIVWTSRWLETQEVAKKDAAWQKKLASLKASKAQATSKLNQLAGNASVLALGFEPKQRMVDVAAIVAALTPDGVWMTGFTIERGKPLTMRGTAMNSEAVAVFLEKLSALDRFRDVKLAFANNAVIEGTNVVQFSITAHVIGNLPLVVEENKRR